MANSYQILLRQDSSENWILNNPVLALGEPAWETDTGLMKMGNGISVWTALPYFEPATGPLGPAGFIGQTGPIGGTGLTATGWASTGSNLFFGNQILEGGIKLEDGFALNPSTFTGTATIYDGKNGSLVGPITIMGTINVEGSGVLAILG